jgi:hypothetical protein
MRFCGLPCSFLFVCGQFEGLRLAANDWLPNCPSKAATLFVALKIAREFVSAVCRTAMHSASLASSGRVLHARLALEGSTLVKHAPRLDTCQASPKVS